MKGNKAMGKNVIAYTQELQREVDRRYALSGHKPDGFGDSMFEYKFAILSELYELDEELGMPEEKILAYAQVAELYKSCASWN